MKHALILFLALFGTGAHAACYADYKAKRDTPLRLHYGVAEISGACTRDNAQAQLQRRLEPHNWTLLTVIGTFDETGLDERKDSAGQYHLRF